MDKREERIELTCHVCGKIMLMRRDSARANRRTNGGNAVCAGCAHRAAAARRGLLTPEERLARRRESSRAWERNNPQKVAIRDKRKRASNRDRTKARDRRAYLWARFKLRPDQYDAMLESQGGGCAICGASKCKTGKRLAVDHDHKTGAIRGILCAGCNQGLGVFVDDPDRMFAAAHYILKSRKLEEEAA